MNNGYSWKTDDIIRVTDDAVTRDTEFFGEMQYAEDITGRKEGAYGISGVPSAV